MIVYKVVNGKYGSVSLHDGNPYYLKYRIGKVTSSLSDTLGIFCFSTIRSALSFAQEECDSLSIISLLKVEGLGNPLFPPIVSSPLLTNILGTLSEFYRFYNIQKVPDTYAVFPVEGTVCFPSIKVLNKISWSEVNESDII